MPLPKEHGAPELILVVDDEPLVLSTVCNILRYAGFRILRALSAEAALSAGAAESGPIDLMLSDVIMPGLNGPQLAERFAGLHRETKYLFMAGYAQHPQVAEGVVARGWALLPKPFLPDELIEKVRQILAQSPNRTAAARA